MAPTAASIRRALIGEDNTTLLSDTYVTEVIADAQNTQSSTDDTAVKWYACYLIADNWQSLGFVTRHDGVSYQKPDAKRFLDKYNARLSVLNSATGSLGFSKVSTNKNLIYDDTTKNLRARGASEYAP